MRKRCAREQTEGRRLPPAAWRGVVQRPTLRIGGTPGHPTPRVLDRSLTRGSGLGWAVTGALARGASWGSPSVRAAALDHGGGPAAATVAATRRVRRCVAPSSASAPCCAEP